MFIHFIRIIRTASVFVIAVVFAIVAAILFLPIGTMTVQASTLPSNHFESTVGFYSADHPNVWKAELLFIEPTISPNDETMQKDLSLEPALFLPPPVAVDDNYGTNENVPLIVTLPISGLLGNDSDPDLDPLTVITDTNPTNGSLSLNGIPAGWLTEIVDSSGDVGGGSSMAMIAGQPAIAYRDNTNSRLLYARWNGSSWVVQTVDATTDINFASLAEIGGQPAISYRGLTNGDLKYARWNGASWDIEVADSSPNIARWNSLTEINGQPGISYYDSPNSNLKYARWNGASWDIEVVDSVGTVGLRTSIISISNQPAISYYDSTNGDLKYARWNGASWDIEVVDSAGDVGSHTSLEIINGQPAISYQHVGNLDLKYARWNGASWDIEVIDSVGDVGTHTSLAMISGQPAISYRDDTNGNLKYAHWNGSSWDIEVVDNVGDTGFRSSLISFNGQPAISYYNSTDFDLKYAYIQIDMDGTFTYSPHLDVCGVDTFSYHANDGVLDSNIATVTIDVVCDNLPPIAVADSYTTTEDITLAITLPISGLLSNDSDAEFDPLTAISDTNPMNGSLSFNIDGTFTYTPTADFCGVDGAADSFSYHANDGNNDSNIAMVTLNVVCVNDPPLAVSDSYSISEDITLTVLTATGVLSNDSDVDSSLTAVLDSAPTNAASFTFNSDGSFSYDPMLNFCGTDSFDYHANDGTADSSIVTVSLNVACVNDPPVAVADSYTTTEDIGLTVIIATGVLTNDTDVELDPLTAISDTNPMSGTLSFNPDGTFTYTPNADFCGADSFSYHANDGNDDSNAAMVTLNVVCVNDPPTAVDDSNYTAAKNSPLIVTMPISGLLGNDNDLDLDPLTAISDTNPISGSLSLNLDGTFTYTPDTDFCGADTFTYHANDGLLDSNIATVTVTVCAPPTAVADDYSTNQNVPLTITLPISGLLSNDIDLDLDGLTAITDTNPTNGNLNLNLDGTFVYTPNLDFCGVGGSADSFTYHANDGSNDSNIVAVTIDVICDNVAPTAVDDFYNNIAGDSTFTISLASNGLLANDTDPDLDPLTAITDTNPLSGTVSLNGDGTFTYTPDIGFCGVDSFTYHAYDGFADSNIATVTFEVCTPIAVDDNYSTNQNIPLIVTLPISGLLGNDSDPDLDPLTVVTDSNPANGTLSLNLAAAGWISETVDSVGTVGEYTSLAIINGQPAISYYEGGTDDNLKYARFDGSIWQIQTIDSGGDVGRYTSLAEINGQPAISYRDQTNQDLKYARFDGAVWQIQTIDTLGNVGNYTSLALINGQPAISYYEGGTADNLKYARFDGAVWQIQTIDSTGNVGQYTSLTDIGGQPAISYYDNTNGDLKYARFDGAVWQIEIVEATNNVGQFTSLVDMDGQPAISYYDVTNLDLKYTRYDGAIWQIQTVDSSGAVGRYNSLAEIGGQPAISYSEGGVDNLKYARFNGAAWQIQTIDSGGIVGRWASLAEIDGQPAISHWDTTNQDLKYAELQLGDTDGTFTYTPDLDFCGVGGAADSFTYHANDGALDSNIATVMIDVLCDPPIAVDDNYSTAEDTPLTVAATGVISNDINVLTVTLAIAPSQALSFTLDNDGGFYYEPILDFNGTDSFTYIGWRDGVTDTAMVTLTVTAVNDAPIAVDDSYGTNLNIPLTVTLPISGLLGNDSDPDLDPLTVVTDSNPANGTLSLNLAAAGWISEAVDSVGTVGEYTSLAIINGQPAISYYEGGTDDNLKYARFDGSIWQIQTIDSGGDVGRYTSLAEINGQPAISYRDQTNQDLKYARFDGAVWQIQTIDTLGNVGNYTSLALINGQPAISYYEGGTADNLKYARFDGAVWQIQTIDSTGNVGQYTSLTDIGGQPAISYYDNTNGDLKYARFDGAVWQIEIVEATNNVGQFTSLVDMDGQPAISYYDVTNLDLKYTRYDGAIWQIQTVDSSGAVGRYNSLAEIGGQPAISYSEGGVDNLKYARFNGAAWQIQTIDSGGIVGRWASLAEIDGQPAISHWDTTNNDLKYAQIQGVTDGTFTYTPTLGFCGVDTFTYHANDGFNDSNIATVMLGVGGCPTAINDTYTTTEDISLTVSLPSNGLLGNDLDYEMDILTIVTDTILAGGVLNLAADGTFIYTPNDNFCGVDSFDYHLNDGSNDSNIATVLFNVTCVNDLPIAVGDSYSTTEDISLTVLAGAGVLTNDSDVESVLTAVLDLPPTNAASFTFNSDGSFTYDPALNFCGTDSFDYHANDGTADSSVVTVTLNVSCVDDTPVAVSDSYTATEDIPLTVISSTGVLINDSDVESAITAVLNNAPTNVLSFTLNMDGSFYYDPVLNFCGVDSFNYHVNDGAIDSNVVTVFINVSCENDIPIAMSDSYSTTEDISVTVPIGTGVLTNDSDVETVITAVLDNGPANAASFTFNSDGSFTYDPALHFCGVDSFDYHANDGTADSNVVTVTLNVSCVDDIPVAVSDSYTATEDTALTVIAVTGVLTNDIEYDGEPLTTILDIAPTNGLSFTLNADGSFYYDPVLNFCGVDSFDYHANDGITDSNVVTVMLNVSCENDAPVAVSDSYTTTEDTALTVIAVTGVLTNDNDVENSPLTAVLDIAPTNALSFTLNSDGSFTYDPALNFCGIDSFNYHTNDGLADSNIITTTLDVICVNDIAIASDDVYTTTEDVPLTVLATSSVLTNDIDFDGDSLTAVLDIAPTNAVSFTLNSDGSFYYNSIPNLCGSDSFNYHVNDGSSNSNIVTVTINLAFCDDDPPVAIADSFAILEDIPFTVTLPINGLLGNDIEYDGDPMTVITDTTPATGTLALNSDGTFTYIPELNFCGTVTFSYHANDGSLNSNIITATLNVICINDAPVAFADSFTINEDTMLTVTLPITGLVNNDTDIENDPLMAIIDTNPMSGSVLLDVIPPSVTTITIDSAGDVGQYNSLAEINGQPAIAYFENSTFADGALKYAAWDGFSWIIQKVDNTGFATEYDILVEMANQATSRDDDGKEALKYDLLGDLNSSMMPKVGQYTSLAQIGGQPAISYYDSDNKALKYASWDGSVWVIQTVDNAGVVGQYTSLAEVGGQPAISYYDGSNADLKYARWNGSAWIIQTVDSDGVVGLYTSLAEVNGQPGISYYNLLAGDLKYAYWNGATWVVQTVDSTNNVGWETSLIEISGQPAISYRDVTNKDLKYARWNGVMWLIEAVDTVGDVGQYSSLAFINGQPSISYHTGSPDKDLKYAYWNGSAWFSQTVDTVGDVGAFSSLAKINGHPGISYYDFGNDDLKYAQLQLGSSDIIYTPNSDFCGIDTFGYQATDGLLGSNVATATINVSCINDAPVAVDDIYTTTEGIPLTITLPITGLLGNDIDVEFDPLTVMSDTNPMSGTLALNGDGTFTYTPDTDWCGISDAADSFNYHTNDGLLDSNVGSAVINVVCLNTAPTAVADSYSTTEDVALTVMTVTGVLTNDTDFENDLLTAVLDISPTNALSFTLNADGSFFYDPVLNFCGADSFDYHAYDGLDSNNVTVMIDVACINDAPVAVADTYTTTENSALTVLAVAGVIVNDSEYDGDPLTAVLDIAPSNAFSFTFNVDGSFYYEPAPSFCGVENNGDSFTYHVHDGTFDSNVITATLNVICYNIAPVAFDDIYTGTEDMPLVVTLPISGLLGNDNDPNLDILNVITDSNPTSGMLMLNATPDLWVSETVDSPGNVGQYSSLIEIGGQPAISYYDVSNQDLKYVSWNGSSWIGQIVDSESGGFYNALAVINGQPAISYYDAINQDLKYAYWNGTSWVRQTVDSIGNVGQYTDLALIGGQPAISYYDVTNQDLKYAQWNGTSWDIQVVDSSGDMGRHSSLTDIGGQPAISYQNFSSRDLKYARWNGASWTIQTVDMAGNVGASSSLADINGQPGISYQDSGNSDLKYASWNGASWIVQTVDSADQVASDTALALVNGQPAISYRDFTNTALKYAFWNGSSWVIEMIDNSGDVGNYTSLAVVGGQPAVSYFDGSNSDLKYAQLHPGGVIDGTFTYTADTDFCGSDSFTYHANDGAVNSNIATVVVNTICVNDAPIATADVYTTAEEISVSGNLILDDTGMGIDSDGDGGVTVSVYTYTMPVTGTLLVGIDGSFTYTPATDFSGTVTFMYQITDTWEMSNMATVTITVTAVNDAPWASDNEYTTAEETPVSGNLILDDTGMGIDSDGGDGIALTVYSYTMPITGTLWVGMDGSFTYTPALEFSGVVTFMYQITDTIDMSNMAVATINVTSCAAVANAQDITISSAGVDAGFSWAPFADSYEIYRSATPYFTVGGAPYDVAAGPNYMDSGVLGAPTDGLFYKVIGINSCGTSSTDSNEIGLFEYAVVPGS